MPSTRSTRSSTRRSTSKVSKASKKKTSTTKRNRSPKPAAKKKKWGTAPAAKKKRAKTPAKKKPATTAAKKKKTATAPKEEEEDDNDDETPKFVVDKIIDTRKNGRNNEYLVSWKGYPESDNTWELGVDMKKDGHGASIKKFDRERKKQKKETKSTPVKNATPVKTIPHNTASPSPSGRSEGSPTKPSSIDESESSGSVNTAGSFAFYWAVIILTTVAYTLIEFLLSNAHEAPLLSGDNTKWVSFLAAAKHWIAVLPPVISVIVLISHPGSTAPFPKYISVGLAWIGTNNFLNHVSGMLGSNGNDATEMAENSAMLLTINKLIAYLFLSNGFGGPRGKNRHGPPKIYAWGIVW